MRRQYQTIFILGGYLSGVMLLILQTWITMRAFLSDSKSITICVNNYGEQYGDLSAMIFLWILFIIGFIFLYYRLKKPIPTD